MSGTAETAFFTTDGTLSAEAKSYVERQADRDLFQGLINGEFCYVLTSRQMGKSSLMVRTRKRLEAAGFKVIVLDPTACGQNLTADQWYDGLVVKMGQQLFLEDELDDFWLSRARLGPLQRMMAALHDVILPKLPENASNPIALPENPLPDHSPGKGNLASRLVVFVDEIDVVRSLNFPTDEFFAAIRELYNRRAEDPKFNRLTFCLLGVATPSELIRDPRTTPFNIGRRIELTDFMPQAAGPLALGLARSGGTTERSPAEAERLLERVFYWTSGHPYLTQRLCQALVQAPNLREPSDVDALCDNLFFSRRAHEHDDNLLFVRERILRTEANLADVLRLYRRIWHGERVQDDETNRLIDTLRLSGIVRLEADHLTVRNRIYHRVFDDDWVQAVLPPERQAEPGSIAVLPFRILGPDQGCEYLVDGLTEELISGLGRVPGLRVASRNSAFQFKGKTEDTRKIGAQLVVQNILEGSLRQVGTDMQISVQLVHAKDGHCVWSETYRYSQQSIVEVLDKIAGAIVDKLKIELGAKTRAPGLARPQGNTEAYSLYLKGRFYWNRRTEGAVRRSIELFQEAIQKDPSCALAYAGLADALNILGTYTYARPADTYPKAKAAATHALSMDENLAPAHCALGCARAIHEWDWEGAEMAFRRSIELNPSYAAGHQWYAINCLSPLGRHEEAVAELQQAQEVDPLSISIMASIGFAYYFAGRYGEAIEQCRQAVEMDPTFWIGHLFLGWACLQKHQFEEAVTALQASLNFGNKDPVVLAALAYAYAVTNRRGESLELLYQLNKLLETRYVPAMELVPVYLALDDLDSALRWLEKAFDERSFKLIYIKVDPRIHKLHDHPRYLELLKAIGLEKPRK